jgi:hypothetical protein
VRTPTTRRSRLDDELIVLAEAEQPSDRDRPPWTIVALAAAAALVVGLAAGYLWRQGTVNDSRDTATSAQQRATDARAQLASADAQNGDLSAQVDGLQQDLARAVQQAAVLHASREEARHQMVEARTQAAKAASARLRSARLAGAPLADGRYVGRLWTVAATASPPRLAIDLGSWFTGRAARDAAAADGQPLRHGRYLRNTTHDYHTVRLSSGAPVTLVSWGPGVRVVSAERLQGMLRSTAPRAIHVAHNPFWITVSGGRVTGMREQPYP